MECTCGAGPVVFMNIFVVVFFVLLLFLCVVFLLFFCVFFCFFCFWGGSFTVGIHGCGSFCACILLASGTASMS